MKLRGLGFSLLGLLAVVLMTSGAYAATCESLKTLSLENTTITLAESVAAGEFSLPKSERNSRISIFGKWPFRIDLSRDAGSRTL